MRSWKLLGLAVLLSGVQFLAIPVAAAIIVTDHCDAWIASLPGPALAIVDEGLGDEVPGGGIVQSLTLLGSGIEIEVTAGESNSVDDLGIEAGNFDTLSDDGTSITSTSGQELDLVLDNADDDPHILTFTLPGAFNAVSFYYDSVNDDAPLVYFSAGNSLVQTALISTLLVDPGNGAGLFGYVDTDEAFTSFTLTHSSVLGGSNIQESFEIGRLTLIDAPIGVAAPAPGTTLLAVVLLLGLLSRWQPVRQPFTHSPTRTRCFS